MDAGPRDATPCCDGHAWCAVTCTAAILGNKWHPVIVHRLLDRDGLGFNELKGAIQGISGKVLATSLDNLQEAGIVTRAVVSTKPLRVAYSLTDAGAALRPVVVAMEAWGRAHLAVGRTRRPLRVRDPARQPL